MNILEGGIIRILSFLTCPVPLRMIYPEGRQWPTKQKCWTKDGNVKDSGFEVPEPFSSASDLNSAILRLVEDGTISISNETMIEIASSPSKSQVLSPSEFRAAIVLVFNAIPLERCLEPLRYNHNMAQILPLLVVILPHITKETMRDFPRAEMSFFLEACLSASIFKDPEFKRKILNTAEMFSLDSLEPDFYIEKIKLRQQTIASQLREPLGKNKRTDQWLSRGIRWACLHFEHKICNSQQHLYEDDSNKARACLPKMRYADLRNPSPLEEHWARQIMFMKGKIARYEGEFDVAELYFKRLEDAPDYLSRIYTNQLVPVMCELGEIERALRLANATAVTLAEEGPPTRKLQEQADLTLAYARLASWLTGKEISEDDFSHVVAACHRVARKPYYSKVRTRGNLRVSAQMAKAMALQMHDDRDEALTAWKDIDQSSGDSLEFLKMVYLYSVADLIKTSEPEEMMEYYQLAEKMSKTTEKNNLWPLAGTLWLDWVRKRIETHLSANSFVVYEAPQAPEIMQMPEASHNPSPQHPHRTHRSNKRPYALTT